MILDTQTGALRARDRPTCFVTGQLFLQTCPNALALAKAEASILRLQNRVLPLVESIALDNTATSIAQALHRPVIRPPGELLLHSLTEHRPVYVRVSRRFRSEFLVEVGRVSLIGHSRLEGGFVFPVKKLAPVD